MRIMTSFRDLGVQDKIADAISEMGWTEPTDIQVAAVPEGLGGRDIFAQAQTGTGKTGTYAMITLGRVTSGERKPSVLVLAPTRELALQIELELRKLTRYSHHRSVTVYGGASISDQMYKLKKGCDIVVGTPGRVKDMIERGSLDLSVIREVVLDEADRMLDMGFSEELDFIMSKVPAERQTLLFSATMASEIKKLAMKFMKDPLEILVSRDEPCSDLTTQYFVPLSRGSKRETLWRILNNGNPKVIVFCQTKKMVDELFTDLSERFKAGAIHGDMPQLKREKVIRNFRNDKFSVLVATDVAARGLDVNNIDCVINYDVSNDPETYIHRIGRTGRAGKEGMAISFVTKREDYLIKAYERATGKKISRLNIDKMEPIERKDEPQVFVEKPVIEDERVVKDRSTDGRKVVKVKVAKSKNENDTMTILKINVGKDNGFGRTKITELIRKHSGVGEDKVGRIGLGSSASYVEVASSCSDHVIGSITGTRYDGSLIIIQVAPKKVSYHEKTHGSAKSAT